MSCMCFKFHTTFIFLTKIDKQSKYSGGNGKIVMKDDGMSYGNCGVWGFAEHL